MFSLLCILAISSNDLWRFWTTFIYFEVDYPIPYELVNMFRILYMVLDYPKKEKKNEWYIKLKFPY